LNWFVCSWLTWLTKYCKSCGRQLEDSDRYCDVCGKQSPYPPDQIQTVRPQTTQQQSQGGGHGGAIAAIFLLLLIIGGAFLFFSQPHGSSGSPIQCVPHQETVYVGYVRTATETIQFTEDQRITQFSYEKGVLLYTVYLANDQGQKFEYHYVIDFNLTPTTIVTGC